MNSIAFVYLETRFRLPDYIAVRFNLKITHVHAGLLLGTGPLVDPGFDGRLLIPLHNLTAEDYTLRGGEGLIWLEFTKLSPNLRWQKDFVRPQGASGVYRTFPLSKDRLTPQDFFLKARKASAPGSSIPEEIRRAEERASEAVTAAESASKSAGESKDEAKSMRRWITWGGIIAIIALLVSLSLGLLQVAGLVADSVQYVRGAKDEAEKEKQAINAALGSLKERLSTIEKSTQMNQMNGVGLPGKSSPSIQDQKVQKPSALEK